MYIHAVIYVFNMYIHTLHTYIYKFENVGKMVWKDVYVYVYHFPSG